MSTITFYEKPGCINNTRQKALLTAAGHVLDVHNLLTTAWTPERLRPFFGDLPVVDWFNRTAPQVKSGEVNPDMLDEATALQLMIENPILIRRPLMQVGDRHEIGFDTANVDQWIGLTPIHAQHQEPSQALMQQDLQGCPRESGTAPAGKCS